MHVLPILLLFSVAVNPDTLILTSGDTTVCTRIAEKVTEDYRLFFCNGDTIFPGDIYLKKNMTGTYRFFNETFLKKKIGGSLSLYAGTKREVVFVDVGTGFDAPIFEYIEKESMETYYTFNDSVFTRFNMFGSNPLLVDELKKKPISYNYYKRYRISQFASITTNNACILWFLLGLLKHGLTKDILPHLFISGSGITISTLCAIVLPQRFFDKAIRSYNSP